MIIEDSVKLIKEPKDGEYRAVKVCYTAVITSPLDGAAVFDLILSPTSTANISTDFYLNTSTSLIIVSEGISSSDDNETLSGSGSNETLSGCIEFVVIGDEEDEGDTEMIAYEIRPTSPLDRVVFPSDATSDLILVYIFNIGNLIAPPKILTYYSFIKVIFSHLAPWLGMNNFLATVVDLLHK